MGRQANQFLGRKRKPVYGPVISRRLGSSIGINVFPGEQKVCSLDCIYCFLKQDGTADPSLYPSLDNIGDELTKFFNANGGHRLKQTARFLTFSGNGEPTLHPNFSNIVQEVREWKENEADDLKLAIFTNGTQLNRPEIRKALLLFDKVFLKFDWCSDEELKTISRPVLPLKYDELVEQAKEFVSQANAGDSSCEVILHTAIFTNNRSDASWQQWSKAVQKIKPKKLQLYELEFEGTKFVPDDFFDFHKFQRQIYSLFRDDPFVPDFFYSSPFYVNVDLCYAVDSIIYLPLYIADYDKFFEEQGVKVSHFVSPDGDLGAVDAIVAGSAQFAICDPQAAIESLARLRKHNFDPDNEPKLVAVLINRLALWTLAEGKNPTIPRSAILQSEKIITYESGSTANYVWQWQKNNRFKDYELKILETVKPGDEIRAFCQSLEDGRPTCVITADILGVQLCILGREEQKLCFASYADRKIGKNFLFTGLLASRGVIEKYPGAVQGVITGLQEAIKSFYDKDYMDKNRRYLTEYILNIFKTRKPYHPQKCSPNILTSAIHSAIKEIETLKIYSTSGQVKPKELLNAFRIRLPSLKKLTKGSFFSVCSPVKVPQARVRSQIIFKLFGPAMCLWGWILNSKPLQTGLLSLVLFVISLVTCWLGNKTPPLWPKVMITILAVTASLSAASLVTFFLSIKSRKKGGL